MTNNAKLRALMKSHDLRDAHVSLMLDVSTYTVQSWVRDKRNMPDNLLELLTLKLKQEK